MATFFNKPNTKRINKRLEQKGHKPSRENKQERWERTDYSLSDYLHQEYLKSASGQRGLYERVKARHLIRLRWSATRKQTNKNEKENLKTLKNLKRREREKNREKSTKDRERAEKFYHPIKEEVQSGRSKLRRPSAHCSEDFDGDTRLRSKKTSEG